MPAAYDAGRGYSPYKMKFWMERVGAATGPRQFDTILDVGCGTGRFTWPLATHFSAHVIGVDPSEKMLVEACQKSLRGVEFHRAPAEGLPIEDSTIDLVFLSMVMHHFDDQVAAVGEFYRVLKPGGLVVLRGGTAEQIARYPYVPFFSGSASILQTSSRRWTLLLSVFAARQFNLHLHEVIESPAAATWEAFAEKERRIVLNKY